MTGQSPQVVSSQNAPHNKLEKRVQKHLDTRFRHRVTDAGRSAFSHLEERLAVFSGPVIIDAGCGTGESTLALARLHIDALVVGIDKSAKRLQKAPAGDNEKLVLVRMDLVDFWCLWTRKACKAEKLYLLYPNPWPKPGHLQRRWHGHAVFPLILESAQNIELRCNWRIYATEWLMACEMSGWKSAKGVESMQLERAISPHERKYLQSGHDIFRCIVEP